jgi:hypothetical protein
MRGKGIFGPMKISKSITFVRQLGNPELPHLAVHSIFPPHVFSAPFKKRFQHLKHSDRV